MTGCFGKFLIKVIRKMYVKKIQSDIKKFALHALRADVHIEKEGFKENHNKIRLKDSL